MRKHLSLLVVLCIFCSFAAGCSDDGPSIMDFTKMSDTMIAAEMSNMRSRPNDYVGKIIKLSGEYNARFISELDGYAHFIVYYEGDACCPPEEIEFRLSDENAFSDDFLEDGVMIELEGVFESYRVLGRAFSYLSVDGVIIL